MTTPIAPSDWHHEPWAQQVAGLGKGERAALISAALLLLSEPVSDPLESELNVLIECAQSDDLDRRVYDPAHRIDMQFAQCIRLGGQIPAALAEYAQTEVSVSEDIAKLMEASASKPAM